MRKIEVPTDTPATFLSGDTAADILRRKKEREDREIEEAERIQRGGGGGSEKDQARKAET